MPDANETAARITAEATKEQTFTKADVLWRIRHHETIVEAQIATALLDLVDQPHDYNGDRDSLHFWRGHDYALRMAARLIQGGWLRD